MREPPSYEDIQAIFLNHRVPASAAEAHGALAGLLCVDGRLDCGQWLGAVFGEDMAELTEFVRAGVQLVRSEFEQNASPQLH